MGAIYLISGDDDFARKQRARETAAMLTGEDEPENAECAEVIPCDQPELKPDEMAARFIDAVRTPPFLSPCKVVWLRHHPDLDYFSGSKRGAVEIAELLAAPLPEEVSVLIDGPGLDKRKTVFKNWIKNGAHAEILAAARSSDRNFAESRRGVLAEFARTGGKRLAADAAQYLTEVIGGDSGMLACELEKLLCYVGDAPEITLADCRAIVSRTAEAVIWEYTEAVQNGDRAAALAGLSQLTSRNEPGLEIKLLSLLANSYQRHLSVRMAMQELGVRSARPATFDRLDETVRARYPDNPLLKVHPFRAYKMCESACRFSGAAIASKLTLIRDTGRALVSGGGDPRILLEQLTLKLCAA